MFHPFNQLREEKLRLLCSILLALLALDVFAVVPPPPPINARAYVLTDFHTGKVLAGSHADERMEPASITKVMTAYVVAEELKAGHVRPDDPVPVSEKAWRMEGSRMFIEVGDTVPLKTLLEGMIVQSGNDASVALAEYVAGSEEAFAALMNQAAQRLGMTNSHFANSTGLPDPEHYTTAHDIARLSAALIRDHPEIYGLFSVREMTWNGIRQHNRNRLLWRDPSVDGIKTGHTSSAGYCLAASAERNGMRLISVVFGTESEKARERATQALLNYGFRFFETRRLYDAGQEIGRAPVWMGVEEEVPFGLQEELWLTLGRGDFQRLKATVELQDPLLAPVAQGQTIGRLKLAVEQEVVGDHPLAALKSVEEGGLWKKARDQVRLWLR
ncbi:MAG: D-alanyl-D-alanine carboxypeptidase [Gammaproteobacteria bacterium]|nr:MAG: D-alanyl-D-alanine carboxypeptidase [Gammaproteobacteria bacterium]